jgi:hypothetical protein
MHLPVEDKQDQSPLHAYNALIAKKPQLQQKETI